MMADETKTTETKSTETTRTETTPTTAPAKTEAPLTTAPNAPARTEATEMTAEEKAAHEAKMGKTPDQLERDAWQGEDYDPRNPRGAPGQQVEQGRFNEGKAPQTRDTDWA